MYYKNFTFYLSEFNTDRHADEFYGPLAVTFLTKHFIYSHMCIVVDF